MRTRMTLTGLLSLLLWLIASPSMANTIDHVDITVELQEDGSAIVTDRRTYTATEGTEHFLRYGHLESSHIQVISVEQDGQMLTDAGAWDSTKSREEKAGYWADPYMAEAQEIVFGIGTLGTHDAVITYKVTNIVRNLNDGSQALYWQFINPQSDPVSSLTITVTEPGLDTDEMRAWGFGFTGETELSPGSVSVSSTSPLAEDDYAVLLMIMDEGTIPGASATYDEDAASMEKRAKKGSDWEDGQWWDIVAYLLIGIGVTVAFWLVALPFRFASHKLRNRQPKRTGFIDDVSGYDRDLPSEPLHVLTHVAGAEPEDLIAATILSWVRDGAIEAGEDEDGPYLQINHRPRSRIGEVGDAVWTLLVGASRSTRITEGQMKKYIRRNPEVYTKAIKDIDKAARHDGFQAGYFTYLTKKRPWGRTQIAATEAGRDRSARLAAFKHFLEDFSLLDERSVPEVHLWQDYLVWAAFFGIADRVADQLEHINPAAAAPLVAATQSTSSISSVLPGSYQSSNFNPFSGSGGTGGSTSSGGGGGASGASTGGGTR